MTLQVTGRHVDAGDAFKTYIGEKINLVLEKYIGPEISGHVRLSKERNQFRIYHLREAPDSAHTVPNRLFWRYCLGFLRVGRLLW